MKNGTLLAHRGAWWGCSAALLAAVALLSLMIGARTMSPNAVWHALAFDRCALDHQMDCIIVWEARVPRTLAGLTVGVALGLSGCLMQQLTRNPLADPGVLGVNAGASLAIVLCAALTGTAAAEWRVTAAFGGALCSSLVLIGLGALTGHGRVDPIRLTLIGVALGAAMEGLSSGIALLDPATFDHLRFWRTGSLAIHGLAPLKAVAAPILVGAVLALLLGRYLETFALGEQMATSLGSRPRITQAIGVLAIALLCGSAVAAVGPIAFLGLIAPQLAGRLAQGVARWQLYWSLTLTPLLLLGADVLGRTLFKHDVSVSILTALLGAPVLIALARRMWRGTHA